MSERRIRTFHIPLDRVRQYLTVEEIESCVGGHVKCAIYADVEALNGSARRVIEFYADPANCPNNYEGLVHSGLVAKNGMPIFEWAGSRAREWLTKWGLNGK